MCVADGSEVTVPIADVYIDFPHLKGRHEAWNMENSLYDHIVGNVHAQEEDPTASKIRQYICLAKNCSCKKKPER